LNSSFARLRVTNELQKLEMATTYLKDGPLKVLMSYTNNEKNPTWTAFQQMLKSHYEPRNKELRVRTQLRHLRQTGAFTDYLNKFQGLTIQLSDLTEKEQLVAFTDGLSQDYKYEVVSKKCKTVFEAIEVCSQLDFCKMKFNQNEDMVE
jgi:hypothetical protein